MSTTTMVSPCDICGDNGVFEAIITCCECKISRQHLYCMREVMTEVPLFWSCEECDRKKLFSPTRNDKQHISKPSPQKVSNFTQKDSSVPKKNASGSRFNFKETRVHTGRTKYISCEEAVKLSSGANKSEHLSRNAFNSTDRLSKSMPPPLKKTLIKSPQQSPGLKDSFKPIKTSRRVEKTNMEREMKTGTYPTNEKRHIEVAKLLKEVEKTNTKEGIKIGEENLTKGVTEKNYTSIPALDSYWEGSFNLPNGHESLNGEFKAHPPSIVHNKVFETLKKMNEKIYFEMIPKHQVWMEMFSGYCPDKDDIGLYFFPRIDKSSSLADFLWSKNLVMKSRVDEVELLVLSSKFLQPHCQEFEGSYFLWGVFCSPNIIKKGISSTSKVVHESLVQRVKCEPCDDFPPGFEKKFKPSKG